MNIGDFDISEFSNIGCGVIAGNDVSRVCVHERHSQLSIYDVFSCFFILLSVATFLC